MMPNATHPSSGFVHSWTLDSSSLKQTTKDTFFRLKKRYLPELRALLSDCNWLRTNLSIDTTRELQPNEVKLLQFVGLVETVIKEINELKEGIEPEPSLDLINLEAKIVKTILPVKARLHERWQQQKQEESVSKPQPCVIAKIPQRSLAPAPVPIPLSVPPPIPTPIATLSLPPTSSSPRPRSRGKDVTSKSVVKVAQKEVLNGNSNAAVVRSAGGKEGSLHASNMPGGVALAKLKESHPTAIDASLASSSNKVLQKSQVLTPVGPLGISPYNPETYALPVAHIEEGRMVKFFIADDAVGEVDENIFDNISDCGVDLYDDQELLDYSVASEQMSSKADSNQSNLQKRSFSNLSSSSASISQKNKPPGPYYSSAVDLDLSSSFVQGAIAVREEEYMSSRRRRRLNQIVPHPRKPRQADYSCSLCGETYQCTVNENPWWAVYKHECPHCKQLQIPRIDINLNSNAIELDPNVIALYGEGIEDSGEDGGEDEYSDEEEYEVEGVDDGEEVTVLGDSKAGTSGPLNGQEEKAFDGDGLLAKEEASKLLVLMCHARTCNGSHASAKHAEICKSTKFLMLHIRDCKGTDMHGRDCMFPWCKPCKKMLKHLTQCFEPETCTVCNPWCLPESFQQLRKLNQVQFCPAVESS